MVIVELLSGFVISSISQIGYVGVFLLMLLESAMIPIPSEVIMPFSGFLVATGEFNLWYALLAGTIGNLVGSIIAYYVGLLVGRKLVEKYGKYILIDKGHLDLADKWFQKYGDKIIFISRNLPAVRTYISVPAGIARMNIVKFSIYTLVGSIPWNFALLYIGVILQQNWEVILRYTIILDVVVVIGVVAFGIWWWKRIK